MEENTTSPEGTVTEERTAELSGQFPPMDIANTKSDVFSYYHSPEEAVIVLRNEQLADVVLYAQLSLENRQMLGQFLSLSPEEVTATATRNLQDFPEAVDYELNWAQENPGTPTPYIPESVLQEHLSRDLGRLAEEQLDQFAQPDQAADQQTRQQ